MPPSSAPYCTASSCSSGGSSPGGPCSADDDPCWICLGGADVAPLERPCACPRRVHRQCLSRWCVQQAGRQEESNCRFCGQELPDWREAHAHLPKAVPIMTVVYNGVTHQLAVEPGTAGQRQFEEAVRRIFGLDPADSLHLTFGCRLPDGGEVTLDGSSSFEAATHLAAISAGQRLARQREQRGPGQQAAAVEQADSRPSSAGCLQAMRRHLFGP